MLRTYTDTFPEWIPLEQNKDFKAIRNAVVQALLKTKNSYRTVSISPQAIEVLKQQKAKTKDQYVFPSPKGGPISPDSVNNMLQTSPGTSGYP